MAKRKRTPTDFALTGGTPDDPKQSGKSEETQFLETARSRFKLGQDAMEDQLERETDDIRMFNGDQWPADVRAARAGQNASNGLPPVPARPCFTINLLRQPVSQIQNECRQSDLGLEIVPADDFGESIGPIDDTEIKLREGLSRRIQRESEAQDAREWAFDRAVIAGRGFYAVRTRFVEGKSFDQEVYVQRIYNQASVTIDPNHEQPDGSDADWVFIGVDMPWDQYKAEFPMDAKGRKNRIADADDEEWRGLNDEFPDWFQNEGDHRLIRVVEYFYTVRESRELVLLADGNVSWSDEVPEGAEVLDRRTVVDKRVKWAKIDGNQILDETDWPSPFLPIVKVLGKELQPTDKDRKAEGAVRPSRDSQVGFNFMASKQAEVVGLAPIPPLMVAEGQIEGYEAWYSLANTRTLPYLPYRTRDAEGNPVGAPSASPRETPIAAVAQSASMFHEMIRSTTGMPDPTLGNVDPSVRSGVAIRRLVEQANKGTSNFMDNLVRSMRHEGRIINSLLYPIYGKRPGRLARIMTGQQEQQTVMINQPFVRDGSRLAPAEPNAPNAERYQLTEEARFNVAIKVTKAYDTRREQEAATVAEIIQTNPAMLNVVGDLFFANMDGPGSRDMAERMKVMLAPPVQQLLQSKQQGQNAVPPEVQAQMAAMQQQMQQMGAALQEAQSGIQTEQLKAQVQLQIEREKLAAQERIEQLRAQVELQKAQIDAQVSEKRTAVEQIADSERQSRQIQADMADTVIKVQAAAASEQAAAERAQYNQQMGAETV